MNVKFLKNRIFIISGSVVLISAVIGGSFYFGYLAGTRNPGIYTVQGVANLDQGKDNALDFSLFWEAWRDLKDKAVDIDKLKDKDLLYGAVSGLVGSLKDPNSSFFPPDDAKKFSEDISGEFSGIGAEIGVKNGILTIVAPLKDSPAERAGLKSGDQLLKIDATDSANMPTEEAVKLIRGPKGTIVKFLVMREGWKEPREISITRDIIQIPTLDYEMKSGGIAYIHLYNFYEKTPYLFYQAAVKLAMQNPRGIILDLRDNPGGYLEVAENLAGWFLNPGEVVVKEKFRGNQVDEYRSSGSGVFKNIPIVVLINQGSASASEITAGYLRDNRGAKLVGVKSFGKGTVQEVVNMSDGSIMKITIAHWLTPKDAVIDKNGLTPDYEVKISEEDVKAGRDPQLAKATEILGQEIAAARIPQEKSGINAFIKL